MYFYPGLTPRALLYRLLRRLENCRKTGTSEHLFSGKTDVQRAYRLIFSKSTALPYAAWKIDETAADGFVLDVLELQVFLIQFERLLTATPTLAFAVHILDGADASLALTFACVADGVLESTDPDGHIRDVAWVDEAEALRRLARVPWYDVGPLRRYLEGAAGELAVVDRR